MSHEDRISVELRQGNKTVAGRVREALEEEGFEVSEAVGRRQDVLIVDVDSGMDGRAAIEGYRRDGAGVVISGLKSSRERHQDGEFLERPFTKAQLIAACRRVLPGGALPERAGVGADQARDEVTRIELALEDIDLEVESSLVGEVATRAVDLGELDEAVSEDEWEAEFEVEPSPAFTLAAVPSAKQSEAEGRARVEPAAEERSEGGAGRSTTAAEGRSGEAVAGLAGLIGQHWHILSLTARPDERAARLARVLEAGLARGPEAARQELERLPKQDGFWGTLGAWSLRDVMKVLASRSLRGRLEVSSEAGDFMFLVDGGELDEIEELTGDHDQVLLDILHERGALIAADYDALTAELHGEWSTSLEVKLRIAELVSQAQLEQAREVRAARLFRRALAGATRGHFVFARIDEARGMGWPAHSLGINIKKMMTDETPRGGDSPPSGFRAAEDSATRRVSTGQLPLPEREQTQLGGDPWIETDFEPTKETDIWAVGLPHDSGLVEISEPIFEEDPAVVLDESNPWVEASKRTEVDRMALSVEGPTLEEYSGSSASADHVAATGDSAREEGSEGGD